MPQVVFGLINVFRFCTLPMQGLHKIILENIFFVTKKT